MEYYRVTQDLSDFVEKTEFADLPAKVVQTAKRLILDTIGTALGGYSTDVGPISLNIIKELGGNPVSTLIGTPLKSSCVNAAFVNAKMANALDFDDVFYNSSHIASPTISAALAVAEYMHASGKEVLTAVALGYDLAARVGVSGVQPRLGGSVGFAWHTIGSAVASAKLLKLNGEKIANALGIACANAPVTCQRKSWPYTMLKYGDMGVIASQGVLAALASKMGHTGSTSILEGENNFWRSIGGERVDNNILLKDLGKKWYILNAAFKPYPVCRWICPALDLFTKAINTNKIELNTIQKVVVGVHPLAKEITSIYKPTDYLTAQMSIPYNMALIAFGIPPSAEWQSPKFYKDPDILEFAKKVHVVEDPDVQKILSLPEQPLFGYIRGSTSLHVSTGTRKIELRTEYAKGDPWVPETRMTDKEISDKFRNLSSKIMQQCGEGGERVEKIIEAAYHLDEINTIDRLMSLTRIM